MTQEFNLSVTPVGTDIYLVRTEKVAPGVPLAEEQVIWPVSDWLNQARQLLNDPMLGLLQMPDHRFTGERPGAALNSQSELVGNVATAAGLDLNLVSLGQQLYNALFQGTIRDSWLGAQLLAQDRSEQLRLRLGLKDRRLACLPWEILHADDRPLAAGTDVVFSRYQPTPVFKHLSEVGKQEETSTRVLKILMAIAAPSDRQTLELEAEALQLKAELERTTSAVPAIQLEILAQPDREQLTQALEHGQYRVFHYAGHSDLGRSGGEIYLVSRTTGLTEKLSGDDLAGLLVNNGIRMGVFNSCRGASGPTSDLAGETSDRNLAEALVKRGIPVLAMVERIPDRVALTFSQLLYRNLKQGYPVDLSLNRVRQGLISAYGSHQLYWALPILYLQPDFDGCLTARRENEGTTPHLFAVGDNSNADAVIDEDISADENSDGAIATYQEQLSVDPNNFEAYNYLGLTLYDSGHLSEAIAAYQLAVQANPDFADAYNNLGVALYDLGRIPEAIAAYQQVLDINPQHGSAQNNLDLALQYQPESSSNSAAVPDILPVKATNSSQSVSDNREKSQGTTENKRRILPVTSLKRWLWLGMGVTCTAFLLFGFYRWQFGAKLVELPPAIEVPTPSPNINPNSQDNLTARATQLFEQGDLPAARKAVEQLLDEGLLNFARTALDAVPNDQIDRPEISFLRGRLAWQEIQQGNQNYSFNDVRRFWEWAAKNQENNPTYYNALGFAYYAEGNWKRANSSWLTALKLLDPASTPKQLTGETCAASSEAGTACAGLALVLAKSAQNQNPLQKGRSLDRAINLHQLVIQGDPIDFQPQALEMNNWLWTQAAIEDWRSLFNLSANAGQ